MAKFEKGRSGNPGGRPKAEINVQVTARSHSDDALAVIVKLMSDDKASRETNLAAARAILDRAWGRPAQSVAVSGDVSVTLERLIQESLDATGGE